MSPALRKLALTVHVVASVGWLGAVAAFLALAVAGLRGSEEHLVRGAYLAIVGAPQAVGASTCSVIRSACRKA